jgi:hypothetical protein
MVKNIRSGLVTSAALALGGCAATTQMHSELDFKGIAVEQVSLDDFGVGILTPSAPTGKESDKQALGDALGDALEELIPNARVMPLPDMLSAINESGLAADYARMIREYESTGILERDALRAIAESGGVRYVAKFNLSDFDQRNEKRMDILGIRMFDTWRATIRVHLELWDSQTGQIAWQGNEELAFAREGVKEQPVSFSQVARLTADHLVNHVGESGKETTDRSEDEGEPETIAAAAAL